MHHAMQQWRCIEGNTASTPLFSSLTDKSTTSTVFPMNGQMRIKAVLLPQLRLKPPQFIMLPPASPNPQNPNRAGTDVYLRVHSKQGYGVIGY